jgi:hypothetical protein
MTIYDDPNVLVIHLKRFDGIFGAKIQHVVEFPASLTLEPFICASRKLRRNSFDTGSAGSSSTHTALRLGGYHSNGDSNSSSSSIANRHQQWRNGMGVGNGCHGSSGNGSPGQQQQQQQHSYQGQGSSSSSNGNSFNSHCSSGSSQRTSRSEYVLQGLLVHQGFTANSGHYFAYCKDGAPPAGAWHCMNDSTVSVCANAVHRTHPTPLRMLHHDLNLQPWDRQPDNLKAPCNNVLFVELLLKTEN